MYQIMQKDADVIIYCNGAEIIGGMQPCLTREDGGRAVMTVQGLCHDGSRTTVTYSCPDDENVSCALTFEESGNALCCTFSGNIACELSYPADAFSPRNGIALHISRIPKEKKYLGMYRKNLWWTKKFHTDFLSEFPARTQSLIWKSGSEYHHMLPLADNGLVSALEGCPEGLEIQVQGNTTGILRFSSKIFTLTSSADPFVLGDLTAGAADKFLSGKHRTAAERRYPEEFEYLGWCSWNAFYDKVHEEGVLQKAEEFCQKGVPVRWFLIDHGWSEERDNKLYSFREDRAKFPSGLRGLKEKLREKGVRWLGVWQGMGGHWGTVAENSPVQAEMHNCLLRTNGGDLIPYPDRRKAFAFWDAWHGYLAEQGVDFVKVDIQSSLAVFVRGIMQPEKAAREAHSGLEASIGIHFDGSCINSMAMGTETFLSRPVSGLSRNSDDFFPHRLHSFTAHTYDNAYNSLYHTSFVHGDWDMWWTEHEDARNNAILRAVSGGPVYVSDCVDHTIAEELRPLILSDGRVLRCDYSGRVTESEILEDPADTDSAFKVWNMCRGTGYLGVFALAGFADIQKASVSAPDIPGFRAEEEYLFHQSGEESAQIVSGDTVLSADMKAGTSTLYSFTPFENDTAFLGLLDKYISTGAVREAVPCRSGMLYVLCESGKTGYACRKPHEVRVCGEAVVPRRQGDLYILDLPEKAEPVSIEIRIL